MVTFCDLTLSSTFNKYALRTAASKCENFWCDPGPGGGTRKGRHPVPIGAAHMTEYVATRHQPVIKLVILSNQPRGGTQQSAAAGEGTALDWGGI